MELKIMPSDPDFWDVELIADWIAKLKHIHLFSDLKDLEELFEQLTH